MEQFLLLGTGNPSRHKIKDMVATLCQFGPITETNVYNWFQNKKARKKRKLSWVMGGKEGEEVEGEEEEEGEGGEESRDPTFSHGGVYEPGMFPTRCTPNRQPASFLTVNGTNVWSPRLP